ncbi:hypothetical protein BKA64DRAFT_298805 [Cadophora sp. MPI-SDFR-AT-0126]|nr:hypothetical protein BKA64DRAFT_298805 [Leotiomycetes sp. MPI-SDFR-AT-0126]
MFSRLLVAIVVLAFPRSALSADKVQCFYPDGSKADADIPCFRNDSLSRVCCGPNQVCSTNNLCVNKAATSPVQTFRGSCLDSAFGPSCPTFCTGSSYNPISGVENYPHMYF